MGKVPKASKSISHAGSIRTVKIHISSGSIKVTGKATVKTK